MQSIVINERSAATVRNILDTIEAGRKASEHLPTYVEALGAALEVPSGWRFDVQVMAFMPPHQQENTQSDAPEQQGLTVVSDSETGSQVLAA